MQVNAISKYHNPRDAAFLICHGVFAYLPCLGAGG